MVTKKEGQILFRVLPGLRLIIVKMIDITIVSRFQFISSPFLLLSLLSCHEGGGDYGV